MRSGCFACLFKPFDVMTPARILLVYTGGTIGSLRIRILGHCAL